MKKFRLSIICMLICSMLIFPACKKKGLQNKVVSSDKYRITIACQSEESESAVLEDLAAAFEAKYPNYEITVKTFSGKNFESYMLQNFASNIENSPHIVWTSDSTHARWHKYFTDLRPFYERDLAKTDYSLYYESMLDTAALNGEFRPTANYKGTFKADKKDTATGTEYGANHSQYGIYYAPRDYNKPAIVCNTALFAELDEKYEEYLGSNLPEDYVSTTQRLNDIVAGNNWSELDDLFDFAKMIADRINYIVKNAGAHNDPDASFYWKTKYAIDLKLNWEPTYVTILNALGIKTALNADGTVNLDNHSATLEELHSKLYEVDRICNSTGADTDFAQGFNFLKVVSRPVISAYITRFQSIYGSASLQCIQIPTQDIAAGNSGYAMNYYYSKTSVSVNGVTKSYPDICWDFIKFIITEEGQEVAGASGHNIPVLKSLSEDGAWRHVNSLQGMNHDAWVAGGELRQDWFNIYEAEHRTKFRAKFAEFFTNYTMSSYGYGSLAELFKSFKHEYAGLDPQGGLRK